MVARLPQLPGPFVDIGEGLVLDDGGRGKAVLEGRRVDDRLEGGAGLAQGLDGAVELAFLKGVAADHGLDLAGLVVHGQERPVHLGLLLQGQLQLLLARVHGQDPEQGHVPGLEQARQGLAGPLGGGGRQLALEAGDAHRGLALADLQHHALDDLVGFDPGVLPGRQPVAVDGPACSPAG